MSSILYRQKLSSILLRTQRQFNLTKLQQRCGVTVTDEYRPGTKPRSSLKGVDLLRNPALNKVTHIEIQGKMSTPKNFLIFFLTIGYGFFASGKATHGYTWPIATGYSFSRCSSLSSYDKSSSSSR